MRKNTNVSARALVAIAGLASLGMPFSAGANVFSLANIVAAQGNQVPGQPAGVLFGDFNGPSIALDGRITFGGSNIGGVSASMNRGVFSGFDAASMALVAQSGTQAPGGPAGALMQTGTGSSAALSTGSARVSASGLQTFVSSFSGGGVTAGTNDSALFSALGGGSFGILARRGVTTVNGTSGAVLSGTFDTGNQNLTHSANGTVYFKQTMTGGDVSGTTNNTGLFAATGAGVDIIARKGDAAPGAGAGITYNAIGFVTQPNAGGQFLYDTSVQGAGVTTANDTVLYRHSPGSGSMLLAHEGTTIMPGTGGAVFSGGITAPGTGFNNAGQAIFGVTLSGGDVVGTTNNVANFFVGSDGSMSMAVRRGQAAPGTDAFFNSISSQATLYLNNAGSYVFEGSLTGGTATTTNDQGIWVSQAGMPSVLSLVIREGDLAAGTSSDFYAFGASATRFNVLGQMLIFMPLRDGAGVSSGSGLFAYDPAAPQPLALLLRTGDQLEVAPGVFKTVTSVGGSLQFPNGAGSSLALNDFGQFVFNLVASDGTDVVITGTIPAPTAAGLVALSALFIGRRRRTA